MVQFQNVSKVYDNGFVAIKNIDFVVEEGEFVFLIGPSGSGKTTLIELLIRDEKPTEGKIFIDDMDTTRISRGQVYKLRRQIGVIFQDFKLIPDQTAYENVSFAMEAAGRTNKEIKEAVPYVLDIVGLSDKHKYFPEQLSGGEQQRVAIARAISNNPKVLIADEPTGNLDPASAWDIVQILSKINNWGTTVIMSTHGTDIVNTLNKRVIQMEGGLILRDDSKGQYEFSEKVEKEEIMQLLAENKKAEKKPSKKRFKVKFNDLSSEANVTKEIDNSNNKGLFGNLFRGKKNKKAQEKLNTEIDINQDNIEAKLTENTEETDALSIENDDVEKVEEIVDNNKTKKTKTKKTKKKSKPKSNLGLAGKIEEQTEESKKDTQKINLINKEDLESLINEHQDSGIEFLHLPNKTLKDLEKAGYKTIGEIISDGPEKIGEHKAIDSEEVIMIAESIQKLLNKLK